MDKPSPPPPPPPPPPQAKYSVWTFTYSPKEDTVGCPNNLCKFLEEHARKWYLVQETADKKHVQCVFITQKGYSRSWGNKARKDLGYDKAELLIHVHKDLLGAIGYQDGEVLDNHGFSEDEILRAQEYYKNRVDGKYYRDHINTMTTLYPAQVNPTKALVSAREGIVDEEEIEARMVSMGFIWPGMKTTDPYVKQCRIRDGMTV